MKWYAFSVSDSVPNLIPTKKKRGRQRNKLAGLVNVIHLTSYFCKTGNDRFISKSKTKTITARQMILLIENEKSKEISESLGRFLNEERWSKLMIVSFPSPPPALNFFPRRSIFRGRRLVKKKVGREASDWLFKKLVLSVTCVQSPGSRFDWRCRFETVARYFFLSLSLSLSSFSFFFLYILFQINFFVERVSWQPNTLEVSCMLSIGLLAERIGRWPVGWVAGRMDVAML